MEDSRPISFLFSLCLHSLILIVVLFWPAWQPRIDLNQPVIEVGFVSMGAKGIPQEKSAPAQSARAQQQASAATPAAPVRDVQQTPQNQPVQTPDVSTPPPPAPKAPPTPVTPPTPAVPKPTPEEKVISPKKDNVPQPKPKEEDKAKPQTPDPKPEVKPETKPVEAPPTPQPAPKPSANDILKDALSSAKKTAAPASGAAKGGGSPDGAQSVAAALAGLGKETVKGGGGSGDGESGQGNSNVGVDATYTGLVMGIVRQQWTSVPRSDRTNLIASVRVRLSADGSIEQVNLERSSGNPAYDASVLSALSKVGSLPKPPNPGLQDLLLNFNYNEMMGR